MKTAYDNLDFLKLVKESLLIDQNVSFVIKGTSMMPFLKDGVSEVFIKTKTDYTKYDICLFEYKGRMLLHRLIRINSKYVFRGDNSTSLEEVEKFCIIGYVYKYQNNNKVVKTNSLMYKIKIRIFLLLRYIKVIIRKLIKE